MWAEILAGTILVPKAISQVFNGNGAQNIGLNETGPDFENIENINNGDIMSFFEGHTEVLLGACGGLLVLGSGFCVAYCLVKSKMEDVQLISKISQNQLNLARAEIVQKDCEKANLAGRNAYLQSEVTKLQEILSSERGQIYACLKETKPPLVPRRQKKRPLSSITTTRHPLMAADEGLYEVPNHQTKAEEENFYECN